MSPEPVISVRGLRKTYGAAEAVRGIDLDVARGEVVALLGPNGAGKTTTVEILEGYRARTDGAVTVLGHDPGRGEPALRERIGIVLQSTGVERHLTAREAIDCYGGYYRAPRPTPELIDLVGLGGHADVKVGRLSGGLRRRLDLAVALVGRPELIFLDEPTTGFDPSARRGAWDVVRGLVADGTTVLLTTHFMDEAQALADRIAVIVDGRIIAEGTPSDVIGRTSSYTTIAFRPAVGTALPTDLGFAPDPADGTRLIHRTETPEPVLHALTAWALAAGAPLPDLAVGRPSLEDTYLELTGHSQHEPDPEPVVRGRRRRA